MSFIPFNNNCSCNNSGPSVPVVVNNGTIGSVIVAQNLDGVLSGNDPLITVDENNVIGIGSESNSIKFNSGLCHKFIQLTDNETNYNLTDKDWGIQVISPTYETITLPVITTAGCEYLIEKNNGNNDPLRILTSGGNLIDGDSELTIIDNDTRFKVLSDPDLQNWSII